MGKVAAVGRPQKNLVWAVPALMLCTATVGGCLEGPGRRESCAESLAQGRKEDARVSSAGRLPYMVSIRSHGSRDHVCSGVLVSDFHVLTVAHCVEPSSPYSAGPRPTLHIGAPSVDGYDDPDAEVLPVENTHFHDGWSTSQGQNSQYNLAILTVSHAVNKTAVRLLEDHFRLSTGQKLLAVGWGTGSQGPALGESIFGTLKLEPQQFIDGPTCNRTTLWSGSVRKGTVCGLNQEATASCIVDSGAPLLQPDMPQYSMDCGNPRLDFLVGLNIDGAPCGTPARPDLYIDLRPHARWIRRRIKAAGGGKEEL